jgi:hypothetical protein
MDCINKPRNDAALVFSTKDNKPIQFEHVNQNHSTVGDLVLGNPELKKNIFSFLGGRKTRGKKITKKGKTFNRKNNKSMKTKK